MEPPVADGEQATQLTQNDPSICMGTSVNNRVMVYWAFTTLRSAGHSHDGELLCIEGDLTTQGAINITNPKEVDFEVRTETPVLSVEDTIAAYVAAPTAIVLDPLPPPNTRSEKHTLRYRKFFRGCCYMTPNKTTLHQNGKNSFQLRIKRNFALSTKSVISGVVMGIVQMC